ncbi:diguanylate cyclase [Staphylococcus gallinarum]|jgi:diguanylate cyclase|uniref:GGDEF domain-containing protein n=1 Tax=Staphylococcus gallinarum TaxID=1293 RepID=A0A2T4SWE4_STAGA|nr:diguanylate cyclase [Staphylococcus gallinarum]MBU7218087.1 GGDEF domain-containing protein [Staphylococcus gallinarum]MCD8786475.1 GGDEF domain-containing protein [Staphylococcus gallinarum]MCD8794548.1 GGDEF domain-containing protein [Staphylococcus gallinarum]MCD8821276.1 GGDEF domain-containing protein [Staphylococcus gallinarum]MCD8825196.1 GGDEF domain-containing protein [Staphylococcus gallinarum]
MFEAIIYNISVIVAGIYLFHRLQYSENRNMVFSKEYVTVLMTIVALLLSAYPVTIFNEYSLYLTFVPILFLGRFTNTFYTVLSAIIVALINVLLGNDTVIAAVILVVIAIIVGAVGPFLKQNDIISIQILNAIALIIFAILSLISPYYEFKEVLYLIPLSYVLSIASSFTFVDMWHFFSLVNRYENEDKLDYLTGLGNVKEFDRHLNEVTRIAETNNESLGLLLIDIDGFKDVNDTYSHQSGDAVLRQIAQLLKNYVPQQFNIFRNGGEEFSIVLNDYTLDQCVKLGESIRAGVEQSTFHLPNKEVIKLSVSIGVGYLTQEDYKSQRKVFKVADDMLHMAKNEGRNQVMFNPIVKL